MFNGLDNSPFNDSTGLKFLEYLTRGKEKNGKSSPRSRKELFKLPATDASADDFSVRQVAEKENTVVVPAPRAAAPKTATPPPTTHSTREQRSSVFKPTSASTPMVPTTTQTPFRPTKKSIGIQNSPLVEVPLSQEPEIPETPEVVAPVAPKAIILQNKSVAKTPVAQVIPPPAQFQEVGRIYPDLENVGQQQEAIPAVAPPTSTTVATPCPPVVVPQTAPPPAIPVAQTPQKDTPQTIAASAPPAAPPSTRRQSIRCVSPERLMEVIFGTQSEPANENVIVQPVQQTPKAPAEYRQVHTPRNLVEEIVTRTPAVVSAPSPPPSPEPTPIAPEPAFVEPAMPRNPPVNTQQLNDSSFFVPPPTPVLKNFKLVLNDCMSSDPEATQKAPRTTISMAPPESARVAKTTRESVAKPSRDSYRPSTASKNTTKKMHRASELTIPKDSLRHSVVVPSSQKRKLHNTVRDLTPIRSPSIRINNTMSEPIGDNQEEELKEEEDGLLAMTGIAPVVETEEVEVEREEVENMIVKKGRGRPKKTDAQVKEAAAIKSKEKGKKKKRKKKNVTEEIEDDWKSDGEADETQEPENDYYEKKKADKKGKSRPGPKSKTRRSDPEPDCPPPSDDINEEPAPDCSSTEDHRKQVEDDIHVASDAAEHAVEERVKKTAPKSKSRARQKSRAKDSDTESDSAEEPEPGACPDKNPDAVFKMPAAPAPRKKHVTSSKRITKTKITIQGSESDESTTESHNGTRRSARVPKPIREVIPYYLMDKIDFEIVRPINYNPSFREFATRGLAKPETPPERPSRSRSKDSNAKKDVLKDVGNKNKVDVTMNCSGGEASNQGKRRKKTSSATATQKTQKQLSKAFDALKEGTGATDLQMGTSSLMTYRDNFSQNLGPMSSTNVDSSHAPSSSSVSSTTRAIISRTLEAGSISHVPGERIRSQEFNGGVMLAYEDFSRGTIILESTKKRARVRDKPLILNVAAGTVIVNLGSEDVVRLTKMDEIMIPADMHYSLENIGDGDAVILFTWV